MNNPEGKKYPKIVAMIVFLLCCVQLLMCHLRIFHIIPPIDELIKTPLPEKNETNAVIHVGPHKMASTSIQIGIKNDRLQLIKDNYQVPSLLDMPGKLTGHKVMANLAICLQNTQPCDKNFWLSVNTFFKVAPEFGFNILLSSEEFDNPKVNLKKFKSLLQPWKHVRIVVVYRRFYEWLISLYFEIHRNSVNYPSVVEWLTEKNIMLYKNIMYTETVVNRYRAFFDDVVILNMHESRNLLARFHCDYLPNAPNVCRNARRRNQEQRANTSKDLDYKRLIQATISTNSFESNIVAIQAVKNFTTSGQVKRTCVSSEIAEKMLNMSLEFEERLVPYFFKSERGQDKLRSNFARSLKYSLCSIDVDAALDKMTRQN